MNWTKLRWIAFVSMSGTLLQTTSGCEDIIAPIVSSLASSLVTGLLSNLLLTT